MQLFTQSTRLLQFCTCFPEDTLLLDTFSGTEFVSRPFSFQLSLVSTQADLELKMAMGEPASISLKTSSGVKRYFHGHIIQFAHTGSDGGWAFYEAVVGPWLEFLRYRVNCRVFQQMTVIDILKKVFADYGAKAKFDFKVKDSNYKAQTLVCQYEESDLNFVMRLMEDYGLYFFFVFGENDHTLMIRDDSTICEAMPIQDQIDYNVEFGATKSDTINQFGSGRALVSNKFAAKTFDFKKPGDAMLAKVDSNHQMGELPSMERYEFPGGYAFKDDQDGDRLVKVRIEEQELRSKTFQGSSNVRSLTCGHSFELKEHYDLGGSVHDRTFFVMSVTHHGENNILSEKVDQQTVYDNLFTCVRKKIPFRAARVTGKPRIFGMQTATVVGSSGDDIHCDKYGRVLVQYHWDREGQFNSQSLCWVRVASQWAGSKFGFVSLPRVKSEVLISFLEGDPDRPIVIGGVYNETNMPPWELPTNKTQSGVLTRSTTGGGYENSNALRFEDKKGEEEVWLHAEKTFRVEVEGDESHSVGHDRTKIIGHNEVIKVGNDRTAKVDGDDSLTVTKAESVKAKTITLTADDSIKLICGGSVVEMTPEGVRVNGTVIALNPPE